MIDLDVEGSPILARNFLKLVKSRYYTQTLIHHIVPNRFALLGDPTGTGKGGVSFLGLLKATEEGISNEQELENRFLASSAGRRLTPAECLEKGRVVAVELFGLQDTVGSQFLITTTQGAGKALDGYSMNSSPQSTANASQSTKPAQGFLSLGRVTEDNQNILERLSDCYADKEGRPYADWRIIRALVVHDPFEDPRAMKGLLQQRGVEIQVVDDEERVVRSPSPVRPPQETVQTRVPVEEVETDPNLEDVDPQQEQQFREAIQRKEDRSRAVVLEMLGDLPDADIRAPENVLFICKLNSVTTDEDLQLILSRFDEKVHVEIVRDHDTGQSLNYAFAEFTNKEQATQAYLKMNQALVDDRRIVVDFSQSVAKLWDRHRQRFRQPKRSAESHKRQRYS